MDVQPPAADLLVGAVLASEHEERRLDDPPTQTKHQVKGGLWEQKGGV